MSQVKEATGSKVVAGLTPTEQRMHEDLQWAMSRGSELEQQYPGEYLIIWQKQVIAHGIDSEELLDTLSSKERPREELVVFECPAFFESPR